MIKNGVGYPQYPVADTLLALFGVPLILLFRGCLLQHREGRLGSWKFLLILKVGTGYPNINENGVGYPQYPVADILLVVA